MSLDDVKAFLVKILAEVAPDAAKEIESNKEAIVAEAKTRLAEELDKADLPKWAKTVLSALVPMLSKAIINRVLEWLKSQPAVVVLDISPVPPVDPAVS